MSQEHLNTVILPDNGFMDYIRMCLNMHISENLSQETLLKECLTFSWSRTEGIKIDYPLSRFPALDAETFLGTLNYYGSILSARGLNCNYIELKYLESLENGISFMVIEYLPHQPGGKFI